MTTSATLVLLTGHPQLHTPRRIIEEATRSGWAVETAPVPRAFAFGQPQSPGNPAPRANARAPELAAGDDRWLLARTGPFQMIDVLREHRRICARGVRPLQTRRAMRTACDQWCTLRRLEQHQVPVPRASLVRGPDALPAALEQIPGPPWFLKARRGSQGTHVFLCADAARAQDTAIFLWGLGMSVLVEEDLRAFGAVRRHLVVCGRVLASVRSIPCAGEYRSNWHQGGRLEPERDPFAAAHSAVAAVAAVEAVGLPFAGVDSIGDERHAILEVNASPGVEGLEAATQRNLVREMLQVLLPSPDQQVAEEDG